MDEPEEQTARTARKAADGTGRRAKRAAAASGGEWKVQVHDSVQGIPAQAWDALLDASPRPSPFLRHEWFAALHESGCTTAETGWTPLFLSVHGEDAGPQAVCPLYAKTHSYGEYVFDWAWADAYERTGQSYYPKLLCASPFTPVPGSRLLARTPQARDALLSAMEQLARQAGWSSAHLLFMDDEDRAAAQHRGWLMRGNVQFHWENRQADGGQPYADFTQMLAAMQREKRKKIQQERRRVQESGVVVTAHEGGEIGADLWDFFHACYTRTYREHGSRPYLNRDFFERVGRTMASNWLMFVATLDGVRVAASLIGIDRGTGAAYGRYWGAQRHVPLLHFELCYYAPLQWCIAQGLQRFEGGAQGEHKMARGLLPVRTWSAHWLAHAGFAQAVADHLERESSGVSHYVDELGEHNPFKSTHVDEGN